MNKKKRLSELDNLFFFGNKLNDSLIFKIMKAKFIYIIPTLISFVVFLVIIKPGFFNIIPFMIHQNYFRGTIKEKTFIYIFDFIFCVILWYMLFIIYKSRFGKK